MQRPSFSFQNNLPPHVVFQCKKRNMNLAFAVERGTCQSKAMGATVFRSSSRTTYFVNARIPHARHQLPRSPSHSLAQGHYFQSKEGRQEWRFRTDIRKLAYTAQWPPSLTLYSQNASSIQYTCFRTISQSYRSTIPIHSLAFPSTSIHKYLLSRIGSFILVVWILDLIWSLSCSFSRWHPRKPSSSWEVQQSSHKDL